MKYSNKEAAELIKQVITYLKNHKISQQDIESRINYTSLSKAKNFDKYPQPIIEKKTRNELLEKLLSEFNLVYNDANQRIELNNKESIAPEISNTKYYVMHYYAFARGLVDRALIQIINRRKVIMDYRINEHWEGTFNVIENYTFIEVTKMGYATPVKKLLSLFSGTVKYGHDYLLGTYSTIKRDGFPAAGRIILEKAKDQKEAQKILDTESDYRIIHYLKDNVYITKPTSPKSLDEIMPNSQKNFSGFIGDYKLIIPTKDKKWLLGDLIISKDFLATIIINHNEYRGYCNFVNLNVMSIDFSIKNQNNSEVRIPIINLHVNIRRKFKNTLYSCSASSSVFHGQPSSFSSYIVPNKELEKVELESLPMEISISNI